MLMTSLESICTVFAPLERERLRANVAGFESAGVTDAGA
jgi:hypothetical protein